MLEQPLRVVGLALLCALATATLATVTFVVSNLVLSVVAVLGPAVPAADAAPDDGAVQGLLVSGESDPSRYACRDLDRDRPGRDTGDRCAGQREPRAVERP